MYILYDIGLVLSLLMGGVIGLMLARARHRRYRAEVDQYLAEVDRYLKVYADMALSRRATADTSAKWRAPAA